MTSTEIRSKFFEFFQSKGHKIVASAPIVNKNDPTLMFTNAGMNQFKDFFLGNQTPDNPRIADSQKCLRVSGKHNDLEEVGVDSYHHTMFEMLGNWSIGDYFKTEAIAWAWEILTEVYGLPKDRLYVSVFEGDKADGLEADEEAADIWKKYVPVDRILYFDRKDNFWEMGETGPCGPCSEIHIDIRPDAERKKNSGKDLVNADHPLVIEIWNLVFIQFNRLADGSLQTLPAKHIDTGMGFERLCMAIQGKQSNYDTDVFSPFVAELEKLTGKKYEGSYDLDARKDIAFRVIVDHVRAVSFCIADGQLPSNTGAGYVVRRILRRAVRYYYSFLDTSEPLIYKLIPALGEYFADVFPELSQQQDFVAKIVLEEEKSFLRTLAQGLKRINQVKINDGLLAGDIAFELYDTYGFPIDLTRLISQEKGWTIDEAGFESCLADQKKRGRKDAESQTGDWVQVHDIDNAEFLGYDHDTLEAVKIIKYRTKTNKGKETIQLVLDKTPFYAESGGQVGDAGVLKTANGTIIKVLDTQKENDLVIHQVNEIPADPSVAFSAEISAARRRKIESNHSATHLLHAALRSVLGDHVAQKGSLVNDKYLRFDFSHFEKMTDEQVAEVERIVNVKIRENIPLGEARNIPIAEAKDSGAMMLFGEKYGDHVRMITFDKSYSVELCGGCHVNHTGQLGLFKIKSEGAVASGVRRIEALTGQVAYDYVNAIINEHKAIKLMLKSPKNVSQSVQQLLVEQKDLNKKLSSLKAEKATSLKSGLLQQAEKIKDLDVVIAELHDMEVADAKGLAYAIDQSLDKTVLLFLIINGEKINLLCMINKDIVSDHLNAGTIIKELSKYIKGGGGGQAFFATAGGKDNSQTEKVVEEFKAYLGR